MQKYYEVELDISAAKAWQKLGVEFADIGKWTSLLSSSYMRGDIALGATRVCMVGNQETTEIIIKFEPKNMAFAYKATSGVPRWMTAAENHWKIKPKSEGKCVVISEPVIKVKWWVLPILPLMSFMLDKMVKKAFVEFKYWAENGKPHPDKITNDKKYLKSNAQMA